MWAVQGWEMTNSTVVNFKSAFWNLILTTPEADWEFLWETHYWPQCCPMRKIFSLQDVTHVIAQQRPLWPHLLSAWIGCTSCSVPFSNNRASSESGLKSENMQWLAARVSEDVHAWVLCPNKQRMLQKRDRLEICLEIPNDREKHG